MSHTPGPWVVTTAWQKTKLNIRPAPHGDAIADVFNKNIANANLIAAAPELYGCALALRALLKMFDKSVFEVLKNDSQFFKLMIHLVDIKKLNNKSINKAEGRK